MSDHTRTSRTRPAALGLSVASAMSLALLPAGAAVAQEAGPDVDPTSETAPAERDTQDERDDRDERGERGERDRDRWDGKPDKPGESDEPELLVVIPAGDTSVEPGETREFTADVSAVEDGEDVRITLVDADNVEITDDRIAFEKTEDEGARIADAGPPASVLTTIGDEPVDAETEHTQGDVAVPEDGVLTFAAEASAEDDAFVAVVYRDGGESTFLEVDRKGAPVEAYGLSGSVTVATETEEPVTDEPATEDPVTEEPVDEQPVTDEPVDEQPVTDEPAVEDPAIEDPAVEQPVTEEPAIEQPVTEEPVDEGPAVDEPTDAPSTDEDDVEATATPIG